MASVCQTLSLLALAAAALHAEVALAHRPGPRDHQIGARSTYPPSYYQYYGQSYSNSLYNTCPPSFELRMVLRGNTPYAVCQCPYGTYQSTWNGQPYCMPYAVQGQQSGQHQQHKGQSHTGGKSKGQQGQTHNTGGLQQGAAHSNVASPPQPPAVPAPQPAPAAAEMPVVPLAAAPIAIMENAEPRAMVPGPQLDSTNDQAPVAAAAMDTEETAQRKDTVVAVAVVGSISALVVIASVLVALFVVRKRRRSRVAGKLPPHISQAPTYHKYPEPLQYFQDEDLVCPDSPIFVAPHSVV